MLCCPNCSAGYPILANVPVLIQQPEQYLFYSLRLLQSARRRVEERASRLEEIWNEGQFLQAGLSRLQRVTSAEAACLAGFEKLFAPVAEFLDRAFAEGRVVDSPNFGMGDPGWQADALLPYLLRDWQCDRELRSTEELISAVLRRHLPQSNGASLLVSGCGAGGLLCSLAPGFSKVAGLDLSLPVLLAVRELLEGRDFVLSLPAASPSGVRIVETRLNSARTAKSRHVELIAGDACQTPFPTGSLDCVITPFLLDVVHDPRQLAREVHRILSDSGLWINYGPSSSPDGIWHFDVCESVLFLEMSGFEVAETAHHRNTHLDRRQVDEYSSFEDHVCYLFVARKSGNPPWKAAEPEPFDGVARVVPVHHRGAELIWRQALPIAGESGVRTAFLEQETVKGLARRFEISESIAQALALVDGSRTVVEIVTNLKEQDPAIDSDDAIEAFRLFLQAGLVLPKRGSA